VIKPIAVLSEIDFDLVVEPVRYALVYYAEITVIKIENIWRGVPIPHRNTVLLDVAYNFLHAELKRAPVVLAAYTRVAGTVVLIFAASTTPREKGSYIALLKNILIDIVTRHIHLIRNDDFIARHFVSYCAALRWPI